MSELVSELGLRLVQAGPAVAAERVAVLSEALAVLLALAETLEKLPLEGVAPAFGAPRWQ